MSFFGLIATYTSFEPMLTVLCDVKIVVFYIYCVFCLHILPSALIKYGQDNDRRIELEKGRSSMYVYELCFSFF